MQTFQISNGDLVLANGSFSTVTGPAKVQQDIEIAVLTPYGSDRFHPRYGSVFGNYIGTAQGPTLVAMIQAELTRVIQNYQRVQLWLLNQASSAGQSSPFSQGEVVQSIGKINVSPKLDAVQVSASVNTSSGTQVNVSASVTS